MKTLPIEKLPIAGSSGALLRKQLLQKQLPLHDFDSQACSSLSEEEKQEFEKYLENLKKYVGQGKVTKIVGARPFDKSLMTPANATDVQRFSPQHKPQQLLHIHGGATLRTPSSFVKSFPFTKKVVSSENKQEFPNESNDQKIISEVPHCPLEASRTCKHNKKQPCSQSNDCATSCCSSIVCQSIPYATKLASSEEIGEAARMYTSPLIHREKLITEDAENMLAEALLPPSAIHSQDIIGSTLDEQELMYIRDKLCSKYGIQKAPKEVQTHISASIKFSNQSKEQPANTALNPVTSMKHKSTLANELSEVKNVDKANCTISKLNTVANVPVNIIHSENLQNQVFPYESIGRQNDGEKDANPSEIHQMNNAMNALTMESSKVQNCDKCQGEIHIGDVVVNVEKAKNVWHPGCFMCSVCNELLVDLVYFYYKNKLYCARDLATLLGIPRCFACDELIFVREYTVAEGHNYHVKHFCCWDCDVPLAGQRYISENDRPLCLPCYQKTYAQTCKACNLVIAADQQGVAIKNLNFHANEQCFCCYTCKKNLLDNRFAIKEDKLFCSKQCILKYFN